MRKKSALHGIQNTPKSPLNTFEQNKYFLRLALNKFADDIEDLSELIADMANDYSDLRFKLCETFRLFGNGSSCYAGAEGDVQSLCQGVIYGHVTNRGRVPKSLMLGKIKKMIIENDVAAFLTQCQSIYRSAQENEHIDYYEYVTYQQSHSIDPWDIIDQENIDDNEDDFDSVVIFEQLEAVRMVKAGNIHARIRPLNNTVVEPTKEETLIEESIVATSFSHDNTFIRITPSNNIFGTPSSQFIEQIHSICKTNQAYEQILALYNSS